MKLIAIAALANNNVIGENHRLPWYIPEDLRLFRETTLEQPVIVGSTTFKYMPLLDRRDVYVLTSRPNEVLRILSVKKDLLKAPIDLRVSICSSLEDAYAKIEAAGNDRAYIAGGAQVYAECLGVVDELLLTRIDLTVQGDTRFPRWESDFRITEMGETTLSKGGTSFRLEHWERTAEKQSQTHGAMLKAAGHRWI
jgi:dihydrofolate reductase